MRHTIRRVAALWKQQTGRRWIFRSRTYRSACSARRPIAPLVLAWRSATRSWISSEQADAANAREALQQTTLNRLFALGSGALRDLRRTVADMVDRGASGIKRSAACPAGF